MNKRDTEAVFLMSIAGIDQAKRYAERLLEETAVYPQDVLEAVAHLDEAADLLDECRDFWRGNPPHGQYRDEWTHDE